jgi:hypothetical protein
MNGKHLLRHFQNAVAVPPRMRHYGPCKRFNTFRHDMACTRTEAEK